MARLGPAPRPRTGAARPKVRRPPAPVATRHVNHRDTAVACACVILLGIAPTLIWEDLLAQAVDSFRWSPAYLLTEWSPWLLLGGGVAFLVPDGGLQRTATRQPAVSALAARLPGLGTGSLPPGGRAGRPARPGGRVLRLRSTGPARPARAKGTPTGPYRETEASSAPGPGAGRRARQTCWATIWMAPATGIATSAPSMPSNWAPMSRAMMVSSPLTLTVRR